MTDIHLAAVYISLAGIVHLLLELVWVVLNYWIWAKTKAVGNLVMMIGAGLMALFSLLAMLGAWVAGDVALLGFGLLTVGFFLIVKPVVDAHLKAIQTKIHDATTSKS